MTPIEDLRLNIEAAIGLAQGALARLDSLEREKHDQTRLAAEIAELRREVSGGKSETFAEATSDPLLSLAALCKRYGISRHSRAAEEARQRIPWIEISTGQFRCRLSDAERHFSPKEVTQ